MNNNRDNKKSSGEGYYASLTGFKRAVPIILAALALFVTICFMAGDTGLAGTGIASVLRGLFSFGAYAIPVVLALHALFYAEDVAKGRTVSRIIFSVLTVIIVSCVEYAVTYWGSEPVFAPLDFFASQSSGGLIGSIFAFGIIKVLGEIGLIILAIAIVAIYAVFFFAKSGSAFSQVGLTILSGLANVLAAAERGVKKAIGAVKKAREKKMKKAADKKSAELLDDPFFEVDNGMRELKISELGILESKKNSLLEEKITFNGGSENTANTAKQAPQTETVKRKIPDISYGLDTEESVSPTSAVNTPDNSYGLDENAENVFTKSFDPFDFATNQRLSTKMSSRAAREAERGIGQVSDSLMNITEEDVKRIREQQAEEKRRADFERRKNELIQMAKDKEQSSHTYESRREVSKTVEFTVQTEQKVESPAPIESRTISRTYEKPDRSNQPERSAADEIADIVAMNNPAYTRSFNESRTYMTVSDREKIQENEASEHTVTEFSTAEPSSPIDSSAEFKPYTEPNPDLDDNDKNEAQDDTLRIERTMLYPSTDAASAAEDEVEEDAEVQEQLPPDSTDFEFGEEVDNTDEEEDFAFEELTPSEPDDELTTDDEPIPPEEQNPEVIRQRAMFPFLDSTPITEKHESMPEPEELPEDDEPPFEAEPIEEPREIALPVPAANAKKEEKPKKKPSYSNYVFPPIDLLGLSNETSQDNIQEEIQDNADKLIDTLSSFGVTASIKGVDRGPRITRYEVVPAKGVKVSNIMSLSDDIALNLAADGIRMEAPIPGKSAVGVEIPNKKASTVRLRELIETDDFKTLKPKTSVCMGKDVAGQPVFADIAKMPHALIAGATGMGKSVCINSLMISMLYKARPDEVKFIMIDPKQVEFTMYNGIPHLLVPIVTDVKQAAGTLMWAVDEMERRYGMLQAQCVRNIDAYNDKMAANPALGEPLPRIVIVIDEFAELIMQVKNPVESLVIRIAQKARAAGIHLIIGTQKPVKEVITGLIKSNIPSKISCKVASNRDSILIFDAAGAEKLLDKGDMLIAFANSIKPQRIQCAFVADEEVEAVMNHLRSFSDGASYDESVMEEIKRAADKCNKKGGGSDYGDSDGDESSGEGYLNDRQFLDAVEVAVHAGKISTSLIQRKLSVGYGKAAKFIDVMEDMGIVGESNGQKPRDVLISADEWREKLARISLD